MPRAARDQFNIRSAFARQRAHEIARETGMTASQVVEEALRAYVRSAREPVGRLVRKGKLLVLPGSGKMVTLAEAEDALTAVREGDS